MFILFKGKNALFDLKMGLLLFSYGVKQVSKVFDVFRVGFGLLRMDFVL